MKIFCKQQAKITTVSILLLALAASLVAMSGCRSTAKGKTSGQPSASVKQYSVRGKIVAVDVKDGVLSLDTEAIPGFMEAMTMAYTLQDPTIASGLHAGDSIAAHLQVGAQGAVLSDVVVTGQAVLNRKPAAQLHVPQTGDAVPNFHLLNQSGRVIDIRGFRGRVLVLTFIYTRCGSSQYCPLMSRNFAALDALLAAHPALYSRTHLLSVSFDPHYDTPAVLRSYGGAYTGRYTKERFRHWDFAAPKQKRLASVLQWFDMGVTTTDGKVMQHSLSTAVIGPDGRLRYWYPTNTWTPRQLFQDVQHVLASSGPGDGAKK